MSDDEKKAGTGPNVSRRAALAGMACLSASGMAFALTPRREEHRLSRIALGSLVPNAIPPWQFGSADGLIVARPDEALPQEEYDQLVGRTYTAPGRPSIMLLIAYGSTQGSTLRLHRPETCYPAQGFAISDFSDVDLDFGGGEVAAKRFTAVRDERHERLLYWTRIGNRFPTNTLGEYAAILDRVLRGVVPDGVLVRISTITDDVDEADRAIDDFMHQLVQRSPPEGRRILLGDAIAAESSGRASIPTG